MKSPTQLAIAALSLACLSGAAMAQTPCVGHDHAAALPAPKFDAKGIARTETVRSDFDSKRLAIQVRVDFAPGASFPKHSHPGVEMEGKIIRLKAGESLYIPAGTVHSAKNIGTGVTSELATYLVDKDKPIVILDK